MKKEYIIIYEYSYDKLEQNVADAMSRGYKPHGSMVFRTPDPIPQHSITEPAKAAFIQPMVLKN